MTVLAFDPERKTNVDLMADCRDLGYINGAVVDVTYGLGAWWTGWVPEHFVASDIVLEKSPVGFSVDFTDTGYGSGCADTWILDPPYKLNGTPTVSVDARYGVDKTASIGERHQLIMDGITEGHRCLRKGGHLLLKCQDQVASGKVQWQTHIFSGHAEGLGFRLKDALFVSSYRKQPAGRRQVHSRRNYSTLLVFVKEA